MIGQQRTTYEHDIHSNVRGSSRDVDRRGLAPAALADAEAPGNRVCANNVCPPRTMAGRAFALRGCAICLVALAAVVGNVAHAVPPTGATTCARPCQSAYDMTGAAVAFARAHNFPQGGYITVTSLDAPLFAVFRTYINAKGNVIALSGLTTVGMYQNDNRVHARATKVPYLDMTRSTWNCAGYNCLESTVSLQIETDMTATGTSGVEVPHLIVGLIGEGFHVAYWNYYVPEWQYTFQVFVGETVEVRYPNGYTELWEFQGGDKPKGQRWTRVPNSLVRYGKPVNPPPAGSGKPLSESVASSSGASDYAVWPTSLHETLDPNSCSGVATMTVTAPDGSSVSGWGSFSCQP